MGTIRVDELAEAALELLPVVDGDGYQYIHHKAVKPRWVVRGNYLELVAEIGEKDEEKTIPERSG